MFGIAAFSDVPFSALAGTDISASVTGVYATGNVGSVTVTTIVSVTAAVTGLYATGSVGSVTVYFPYISVTVVPTGVSATGYTCTPQIWCKINTTSSGDSTWTVIAA